jgi:glutathione S-transferase
MSTSPNPLTPITGSAIATYLANTHGLMGPTPLAFGQILSIADALGELGDAFRKLCPYGEEPKAESLTEFFDDASATDYAGKADAAARAKRFLKWYMGRLERIVGAGGYAVGDSITLADVLIYNKFVDTLTAEENVNGLPAWRAEPFSNGEKTAAALAAHPKLSAICATVAAHPNIQAWFAMRGPQGF